MGTVSNETSPEVKRAVERLCAVSVKQFINLFERISWPDSVDPASSWYTSPELCSLWGTVPWEGLDEPAQRRLSFFEAINFYSLNIHGERSLIEGLAHRLHRRGMEAVSPYLHHFLDEENKHMFYFSRFCTSYAGKVYPERKMPFPQDFAPGEEDFLFFGKVLVFEEIVDVYNRTMAKDERLHPVAREINSLHHFEETRHLSFGRALVVDLWQRCVRSWDAEVTARVRSTLSAYVGATWGEYYNPDVYRDAGFKDPFAVRRDALASEAQYRHRREISEGLLTFFRDQRILGAEVEL